MNPPARPRLALRLLAVAAALLPSACVIEEHHHSAPPPADTRLEFEETTNLGYACGGPLTSWTVTNRQTSDQGTAGCEQPILFMGLTPGASYTFDIQGFAGDRLCWQGTCDAVAPGFATSFVDCSAQIEHLCGL